MLPLLEGWGLHVHKQGGEEEGKGEEEEEAEEEALYIFQPANKSDCMCQSVAITVMPLQGSSVLS